MRDCDGVSAMALGPRTPVFSLFLLLLLWPMSLRTVSRGRSHRASFVTHAFNLHGNRRGRTEGRCYDPLIRIRYWQKCSKRAGTAYSLSWDYLSQKTLSSLINNQRWFTHKHRRFNVNFKKSCSSLPRPSILL